MHTLRYKNKNSFLICMYFIFQAFVNCALGIHNVGYVMICLSVVDSVCSVAFGPLVKILGRPFLYIFGAIINIAMAITILHWHPDPTTPVVFFVIAGFWGMADAIWQTQVNGKCQ